MSALETLIILLNGFLCLFCSSAPFFTTSLKKKQCGQSQNGDSVRCNAVSGMLLTNWLCGQEAARWTQGSRKKSTHASLRCDCGKSPDFSGSQVSEERILVMSLEE